MALAKPEIADLYRKRARLYDFSANLYYLVGFREQHYRKRAVDALALEPGSTVVDIGCGTGLNFAHLKEAVGDEGRIIGVDLTNEMLAQAEARVVRNDWKGVELVESDAASYDFPEGIDGMLSTFAVTLVPEYDDVIRRGAEALRPGGRIAILDLELPEHWPSWLVRLFVWVMSPFGVSLDLADRKPWESVRRHLNEVRFDEYFFGAVYLSIGSR